jgi:hypothetical protein
VRHPSEFGIVAQMSTRRLFGGLLTQCFTSSRVAPWLCLLYLPIGVVLVMDDWQSWIGAKRRYSPGSSGTILRYYRVRSSVKSRHEVIKADM